MTDTEVARQILDEAATAVRQLVDDTAFLLAENKRLQAALMRQGELKESAQANAAHWEKAYKKLAVEVDDAWTAGGEENRHMRAYTRLPSLILHLKKFGGAPHDPETGPDGDAERFP